MLKIVNKDKKVVNFKQRHEEFLEWLEEVKKENFSDASGVESALMLYMKTDEKTGKAQVYSSHFRMPNVDDFEYFHLCLGEYVMNWKFENYLKEHISEFLEYVNK